MVQERFYQIPLQKTPTELSQPDALRVSECCLSAAHQETDIEEGSYRPTPDGPDLHDPYRVMMLGTMSTCLSGDAGKMGLVTAKFTGGRTCPVP